MHKCLVCGKAINEGGTIPEDIDSAEHLIPHSIGGRAKVKGLLHQSCNSRSGETWDAALAEQLHPLSHMRILSQESSYTKTGKEIAVRRHLK